MYKDLESIFQLNDLLDNTKNNMHKETESGTAEERTQFPKKSSKLVMPNVYTCIHLKETPMRILHRTVLQAYRSEENEHTTNH